MATKNSIFSRYRSASMSCCVKRTAIRSVYIIFFTYEKVSNWLMSLAAFAGLSSAFAMAPTSLATFVYDTLGTGGHAFSYTTSLPGNF